MQDSEQRTPLHLVVSYGKGSWACFNAIMDASPALDKEDASGATPLLCSISCISPGKAAQVLRAEDMALRIVAEAIKQHKGPAGGVAGCLPVFNKVHSRSKNSPLMCAAVHARSGKVVKALLDAGADPNYMNRAGDTPLLACLREAGVATIWVQGSWAEHQR